MEHPARQSVARAGIPALLELLPVGVFTTDEQRHILSLNPAAGEITGVDPGAVVGRRCDEILHCSFCGPRCAACEASLLGRSRTGFPTDILRPDGSKHSILLDAVPIGEGRVAVIMRNVTGGTRGRIVQMKDPPEGCVGETAGGRGREERIRAALRRTAGCVTRAARLLGVHRTTLWRQMRELGVHRDEFLLG